MVSNIRRPTNPPFISSVCFHWLFVVLFFFFFLSKKLTLPLAGDVRTNQGHWGASYWSQQAEREANKNILEREADRSVKGERKGRPFWSSFFVVIFPLVQFDSKTELYHSFPQSSSILLLNAQKQNRIKHSSALRQSPEIYRKKITV